MVSKVAVMALVAIIAVPILLGYALNLDQITETDYKTSGESVNVTGMLQNGTGYSYAISNIFDNNTKFGYYSGGQLIGYLPNYQKLIGSKTSFPLAKGGGIGAGTTQGLSGFDRFYYQVYSGSTNVTVYYLNSSNVETSFTINGLNWIDYEKIYNRVEYNSTGSGMSYFISSNGITKMIFSGTTDGIQLYTHTNTNSYVDFAAGFIANTGAFQGDYLQIGASDKVKSGLISINLSSVSSSSYQLKIGASAISQYYIQLDKTTSGGVVSWTATNYDNNVAVQSYDLYYDPDITDNTYQFFITAVGIQPNSYGVNGTNSYRTELRYVGGWPSLIGEANYYQIYEFDPWEYGGIYDVAETIKIKPQTGYSTPVVRVDSITYRAFEYPVISAREYDPAAFRENPSTTFSDPRLYGSSLEFGGNTYKVKDGNITIGTHEIPVRGLTLSSVPNENGGYDNKIGSTVISNTVTPSTIRFNGDWSLTVTTISQEQTTYTKTEWTPGVFGWDGIDQNFLMVGLITSIGVFIALAIYIRRTGASLWPALLVCGGAAALFFTML